jgi:hypothetical protein
LLELLNKVWDLWFEFAYWVFGWCVGIAESGLVSAGLPCCWLSWLFSSHLSKKMTKSLLKKITFMPNN